MKIKEILIFSILITGVVIAISIPSWVAKALFIIISNAIFFFLLKRSDQVRLLHVIFIVTIQWIAGFILLREKEVGLEGKVSETECFEVENDDCRYSICFYPDASAIGEGLGSLPVNLLVEKGDTSEIPYLDLLISMETDGDLKNVTIEDEESVFDKNKTHAIYKYLEENVEFKITLLEGKEEICDTTFTYYLTIPYFYEE